MVLNKISFLFGLLILVHFNSGASNPLVSNVDSVLVAGEKNVSARVAQLIEIRFNNEAVDSLSSLINIEFETLLRREGAFEYPFDSIFPMGKVTSKDGLVRIFTWYAVRADGSHIHFGFIQYLNKAKKEALVFKLTDRSDSIENVENESLTDENWFGATYYEIIERKSTFGTLYVLLGWDGNTIYTNKKILESLMFTESGKPRFGKPVFVAGKTKVKRIVFEYSRMASMMLKYDETLEMIVFDHLSPSNPVYNGNVQFYGPDLSYDAFKFENEVWVYYQEIDYKPIVKKRNRK